MGARWLWLSLLIALPSVGQARESGLLLGFELSAGAGGDDYALYGEAPEIVRALGGDMARTPSARMGLRLGYQLGRWFALEARGRHQAFTAQGRFAQAPALDYAMRRRIMPLNLLPRLTLDGDHVGLALGIGPGAYFISTREQGHLGGGVHSATRVGVMAELALALHVTRHASIELTAQHDRVQVPQANALIRDGGAVGLTTIGVALGFRLGD